MLSFKVDLKLKMVDIILKENEEVKNCACNKVL